MRAAIPLPELRGQRTLKKLVGSQLAVVLALAVSTWFELPEALSSLLLLAAFVLALIASVCAGLTVAHSQARIPFRERPSISGRGTGVLTLVALVGIAVACDELVYPRSWPTSVDEALSVLDVQLDAASKRRLAYLDYDEIGELHEGLGTTIRDRFGMYKGNERLLRDCDPEYIHADTCSSIIISRFWKNVRAELPQAEQAGLEDLEQKMNRVRLKRQAQYRDVPLKDIVAVFNNAIRAQVPEDARFEIRYDPAYANERVSVAWHAREPIALREGVKFLAENARMNVRKTPPDVVLERFPDDGRSSGGT